MRYFAVEFPNHSTYVLKTTDKKFDAIELTYQLQSCIGFMGYDGLVYNPNYFISVAQITEPNDKQKQVARVLSEVLI